MEFKELRSLFDKFAVFTIFWAIFQAKPSFFLNFCGFSNKPAVSKLLNITYEQRNENFRHHSKKNENNSHYFQKSEIFSR